MGDMKEVIPDPTVRLVKLDDVEDLKIMEAQLATDSAFANAGHFWIKLALKILRLEDVL